MYSQQQMYVGPRAGGVIPEPLFPNEACVPGTVGVRGFNPPMYPGGGMRMANPYSDGFQNEYNVPASGRNTRHPEFMYHQQSHRPVNPQHSIGMTPQQQQQQQHIQQIRGIGPGYGMSISPRLPGNIGSPVMSPPMHSPASTQMTAPNNQPNMFNNNNCNAFNIPATGSTNGFHFNEEFLGPPLQSPGNNPAVGIIEDNGMDSILGVEDTPSLSNQANTNWKLNATEHRQDLLQRLQNALKDNQSGGSLDSEAIAMEEETFNSCDSEDSYVHRLAQWLAAKFSTLQAAPAPAPAPNPYPDSTTLQDTLSCPKLSSSSDVNNTSENSSNDMLAKANPILAETLAAASDELVSAPPSEMKDNELFSTSSSASSSPVSSSITTTTSSMSSAGICSPMNLLSSSSLTPTLSSTGSTPIRKTDNFHRPNTESGEKGIHRGVTGRRPSGKGNNNNNNNNPHSVDSGIGSPRSTTSTSLYSPKLHGTSPSLVAVSNLESSPGKLS
jgi:hypothetical protein